MVAWSGGNSSAVRSTSAKESRAFFYNNDAGMKWPNNAYSTEYTVPRTRVSNNEALGYA
jgi:hypothetical protein